MNGERDFGTSGCIVLLTDFYFFIFFSRLKRERCMYAVLGYFGLGLDKTQKRKEK